MAIERDQVDVKLTFNSDNGTAGSECSRSPRKVCKSLVISLFLFPFLLVNFLKFFVHEIVPLFRNMFEFINDCNDFG